LALGGAARAIGTGNESGLILDQLFDMLSHGNGSGFGFWGINLERKTKRPLCVNFRKAHRRVIPKVWSRFKKEKTGLYPVSAQLS
jgi:hypothetical protein